MNSTLALARLITRWHRVALFILIACSSGALAQTPTNTPPTPQASPSPTPSLERRFFKNILQDQRAIWTSPLHIHSDDRKWLVPLGVSTTALLFTDQYSAAALHSDRTQLNVSRHVSYLGSVYATGAISGAFYLVGRAKKDARARETGIIAAEALIDSTIVVEALKIGTQRTRPRQDIQGEFFEGGKSFPSGHAIESWTLATVIASEYKHRPFVRFGAFGLAALVSASRFTGRNHFLSDVLVGSAIGYGIGTYVYRTHHDPTLDPHHENMSIRGRSKLLPLIAPAYERRSRSYGIRLAWKL
jgi:membrane-associated phospholipid phosphatase